MVNGVLKAYTKVLAQAITMLESKNQKDRLLIYDALSEIPASKESHLELELLEVQELEKVPS